MGYLISFSLVATTAALLFLAYVLFQRLSASRRSADRLFYEPAPVEARPVGDAMMMGLVHRWLFLAGYRQPDAPAVFITTTIVAAAGALAVVYIVRLSGLLDNLMKTIAQLPSGVGDLFIPIAYLAPWMIFLIVAMTPFLVVRRARRDRVEKVQQDLPLALELLATLSEAGLGFDSALARVVHSAPEGRPLVREFRTYQSDLLAGRTRIESLRRLARRLDVSSMTILVSALIQAEQLGSGIAQALRRQADDLRDRRRERANAFATSLPVKRMFPLVICFMPGIFTWTLGPFFVQLFQYADTFMRVKKF